MFDISQNILIQNMFMNTRTERGEKEREGRTGFHVGDTGYIPLGDIFIKGTLADEHMFQTKNIRCIPNLYMPILVHYCRSRCSAFYPFIYDTT